jgi:hypothetical protein
MIHYKVMTPSSRQEAAKLGARFFNTGRPCRNGHVADRYTSTGNCSACLAASREQLAAAVREAKRPAQDGAALFTYRLHPADHAAALAYCQGLDLQRGRMPQAGQAVVAPALPPAAAPGEFPLPAWLAQARAGQSPEPQGADHVPGELAAVLRIHPTNGS